MTLLLFTGNVQAKDIYVTGAIPKVNGVLAAASGDVIYLQAGKIYEGDVIVRAAKITIRKTGIGADPVVKPVGKGATFCFLQQANNLTFRNIYFDCSGCNSQASHFAVRIEGDFKGTTFVGCTFKEPPAANYEANQTSRKQMNFDSISIDTEYADVMLTNVAFLNVKETKPSILEKADSDSTVVYTGVTISATAVIGMEVPR